MMRMTERKWWCKTCADYIEEPKDKHKHVKRGVVIGLLEFDCDCGRHFIVKCDEKHRRHWVE